MGISVEWFDDSKTILYWQFDTEWTWDDYEIVLAKSRAMVLASSHTVHVIADAIRPRRVPKDGFTYFRSAMDLRPPNMGMIVVAIQNHFFTKVLATTYNAYAQARHIPFRVTMTVDEAYAHIEAWTTVEQDLVIA